MIYPEARTGYVGSGVGPRGEKLARYNINLAKAVENGEETTGLEKTMTLSGAVFYVISVIVLAATVLAVTRRHPIHALVYLIFSFLGTALLFYLLGAPFIAALEVIIYAGAILVLFLFVVMTLRSDLSPRPFEKRVWPWVPALLLGGTSLIIVSTLLFAGPASRQGLTPAVAHPRVLGHFVFDRYWFPVEVVSLLLTIALVGAYFLGREDQRPKDPPGKEAP